MFNLEGKRILVTGASSGIGRKIAEIASNQGASVILVGRNEERLNETLQKMKNPHLHHIAPFDLSNVDDIPEFIRSLTQQKGVLNGVVHSAGIHKLTILRTVNKKNIEESMNINFIAGILIVKECLRKSVCAPGSSLVLISSVTGLLGQSGAISYAVSKGAIITAVKSAAVELASSQHRINCIVPGMVETEMTDEILRDTTEENKAHIINQYPLGLGKPEDVAHAAIFLLSDESKWITGTSLVVDGGYTVRPSMNI